MNLNTRYFGVIIFLIFGLSSCASNKPAIEVVDKVIVQNEELNLANLEALDLVLKRMMAAYVDQYLERKKVELKLQVFKKTEEQINQLSGSARKRLTDAVDPHVTRINDELDKAKLRQDRQAELELAIQLSATLAVVEVESDKLFDSIVRNSIDKREVKLKDIEMQIMKVKLNFLEKKSISKIATEALAGYKEKNNLAVENQNKALEQVKRQLQLNKIAIKAFVDNALSEELQALLTDFGFENVSGLIVEKFSSLQDQLNSEFVKVTEKAEK